MLWDVLTKHAELLPNKILFEDERNKVSSTELLDEIERYSLYLMSIGVMLDDGVVISLRNSIEFVISILSLWRIGATAILVNNKAKEDELTKVTRESNAKYIITDSAKQVFECLLRAAKPEIGVQEPHDHYALDFPKITAKVFKFYFFCFFKFRY